MLQQMGSSSLGHISICSLDNINKDNRYWSSEPVYNKMKEISFGIHQETKDLDTGKKTTSFANLKDGSDKSSFIFAKILDAAFANKPVESFFSKSLSPDLDSYFRKAIFSLESGKKFSLWDGNSTNIPVSAGAISIVRGCYVKYNYFMDHPDPAPVLTPDPDLAPDPTPAPNVEDIDDLEKRIMELMAESAVGPCSTTKKSVRPSKTICGVPIVQNTDDLEERFQRLLDLPNEL